MKKLKVIFTDRVHGSFGKMLSKFLPNSHIKTDDLDGYLQYWHLHTLNDCSVVYEGPENMFIGADDLWDCLS